MYNWLAKKKTNSYKVVKVLCNRSEVVFNDGFKVS